MAELRRQVDRARAAAGVSKTALADRTRLGQVRISRTTVQQFFRTDGPIPSMDTVTALADALKLDARPWLDLRDLAAGTQAKTPPGPAPSRSRVGNARSAGSELRLVGPIPPPALAFQHRGEAIRLRTVLEGGGTAVLEGRPTAGPATGGVLFGMGGVGKSQLAADYARTTLAEGTVDIVVWLTATDRSAIVDQFAQAARELCSLGVEDPEGAARAFLAWLTPRRSTAVAVRWLVVLDNLTHPEDLRGLWPPDSPHGRTLITTRRQDAALTGSGRTRLEIGVFTPAQAVAHLVDALAAYGRTEPIDELAKLAADMGYLPLALSQAAAYLADTGESVSVYRQTLADRATALRDLAPDVLPDQQPHALAAAWALSIDHADSLRPVGLARPLLHLIAHLGPNGIPHSVLTSTPTRIYLASHRTRAAGQDSPAEPGADQVSAAEADRALSALRRLSLITRTPDAPATAVRAHQLVQHAVRDTLTPDQHRETARTAADALVAAWPDVERDTKLAQALRSNAIALAEHAKGALYEPAAHPVLNLSGNSLGVAGQFRAARDHFRRLTELAIAHLGDDHPDTLMARHNLAFWQGAAGDIAGAVAACTDLLADTARLLGEDHPDTMRARAALADLQGSAGDAAGAEAVFTGVLADRRRVLGEDHPDTLSARNNLAMWRGLAGDAAGAAADFTDLLADWRRVLNDDDDTRVLATRHNLANCQGRAGDAAGAVTAFTRLYPPSGRPHAEAWSRPSRRSRDACRPRHLAGRSREPGRRRRGLRRPIG
ncbi:tetratricopeptide repeat protein [Streptomyces sp. NBC_00727]